MLPSFTVEEIPRDVGHNASIAASAVPRCGAKFLEDWDADVSPCDSGKKKAHKLKKHPWPGGTNRAPTSRCPRDFLLLALEKEKADRKGIFAVTPVGRPRNTRLSRKFSETLCDIF